MWLVVWLAPKRRVTATLPLPLVALVLLERQALVFLLTAIFPAPPVVAHKLRVSCDDHGFSGIGDAAHAKVVRHSDQLDAVSGLAAVNRCLESCPVTLALDGHGARTELMLRAYLCQLMGIVGITGARL